MKTLFYKYEGTGNDFVIIDNRYRGIKTQNPKLWKKLCDRHFGIGADGLILIEEKRGFDFKMIYFNADGNESSMCGNGARCFISLAKKLKLFKGNTAHFSAIDGEHEATVLEKDMVKLKMNDINGKGGIETVSANVFTLNTGSPHYVSLVDDVMKINVKEEGRAIRNSEPYKKDGINVNFVEASPGKTAKMRTYERGVEDETLSCGTGTVAAALVLASKGLSTSSEYCDIQTMGGMLKVWFTKKGEGFTDIWLEGPATYIYQGVIEL
jgi:diaminopimelate epimerase